MLADAVIAQRAIRSADFGGPLTKVCVFVYLAPCKKNQKVAKMVTARRPPAFMKGSGQIKRFLTIRIDGISFAHWMAFWARSVLSRQ
jgi:hypothetical protein